MFDVNKIRREFPILSTKVHSKPLVYLDNAATTQKPRRVMDRLQRFYKLHNSNVHRGSHTLSNEATQQFEHARSAVAEFLNVEHTHEIIWTKGATEAANLLAYSLSECCLNAGDTILVSTMEHHANIVPWQLAAERQGASIVPIPLHDDQSLNLDALNQLLKAHSPKIVAITHVSNALGVINPITSIAQQVHEHNALLVVDGSQAVAHLKVDLQQLGADAYFFSGHKCYGPNGIGVLWAKTALLEKMPPWQSGGEMIKEVSFNKTTFNTLPFKFEAGTPPTADAIGLAEALSFLSQQDRSAIQQHEATLRQHLVTRLSQHKNIHVLAAKPDNVGVVSLTIDGWHHQDLALLLDEHGIAVRTGHHCAMPLMESLGLDGTLRISLALYSTLQEVDLVCDLLIQLANEDPSNTEELSLLIDGPHRNDEVDFNQLLGLTNPGLQQPISLSGLLSLGSQIPHWPTPLREAATPVDGCESKVWIYQYRNTDGTFTPLIDSEARIMRGIGELIAQAFTGLDKNEWSSVNPSQWLSDVGLSRFLSPSRTNGVLAILQALKSATV
jgi:cysteine desulfurase/selenocysteine lyase